MFSMMAEAEAFLYCATKDPSGRPPDVGSDSVPFYEGNNRAIEDIDLVAILGDSITLFLLSYSLPLLVEKA